MPRQQIPRAFLGVLASVVLAVALLCAGLGVVMVAAGDPTDLESMALPAIFLLMLVVMLANVYLAGRRTELTLTFDATGVRAAASGYAVQVPWRTVWEVRILRSGSASPVLCLLTSPDIRFMPPRIGWRLKVRAHQRLFGTPLATPLASSGLDESAVLAAIRAYLTEGTGPAHPRIVVTDAALPEDGSTARRVLVGGLGTFALLVAGAAWAGAAAAIVTGAADQDPFATIVTGFGALGTTILVVALAHTLYQAAAGTRPNGAEPVLRVGPRGVEQVTPGGVRRVPWPAVQRVYLDTGPTGQSMVCVATTDPWALVPRATAGARRNQRRHGTPTAVPLAGAGLTGKDYLDAVRYFSAGQVTVA